jgi:hypothetical protein
VLMQCSMTQPETANNDGIRFMMQFLAWLCRYQVWEGSPSGVA